MKVDIGSKNVFGIWSEISATEIAVWNSRNSELIAETQIFSVPGMSGEVQNLNSKQE